MKFNGITNLGKLKLKLFLILSVGLNLLGCIARISNIEAPPQLIAITKISPLTATDVLSLPTTVTVTGTPIPHPMSIPEFRSQVFTGSDIFVKRELEKGRNYRRYYAYYYSQSLKIYELFTIPEGTMPDGGWPAIVFNHGYIPPDIYRTTERYINYVDRLAGSGYVVYRIDYRGHDQSEGEAGGAYGNPGYQIDVMNAIASLQNHPMVNPENIGSWGHSMGGYLTLRAMVISNQVKVGVIWAGVVASYPEMIYNWRRTVPFSASPSSRGAGWRALWLGEYGTPEQNPVFWNSISATSFLADLSGPLQLDHGSADEDVPYEFSIRLAERTREAGKIADLYIYEGDNHNISKYFTTAMDRTITFYDRYLK